jgi:ribosome maturation factor RimP
MAKNPICQQVEELIAPVIRAENLELVEVEYKHEGRSWYLRIYIHKEEGVGLEDCQRVSHRIEDMIEIDNIIPSRYVLEVSSPGLDRPLKTERDFLRNKNRKIRVVASAPVDGKWDFCGAIKDCKERTLNLEQDGKQIDIPLEKITKARLVTEF